MSKYLAKSDDQIAQLAIKKAQRTLREISKKPLTKPHEYLTLLLFARAIKSAKAVMVLARQGYGEDACVSARSVYEILRRVAYLNVDSRKQARRTKVYWLEGVLNEIESADSIERHYRACGKPVVHNMMLNQIRDRVKREPEFKNRQKGDLVQDRIWRNLRWEEQFEILSTFWIGLESEECQKDIVLSLDFCVRVMGNRHVHVLPMSLKSVVSWGIGVLGKRRFSPNCDPSSDFTEIVPDVIEILMLAFSRTIALLFCQRNDNLPRRTARDIDDLLKARANRRYRTRKKEPSPQAVYDKWAREAENKYRQIANIRA